MTKNMTKQKKSLNSFIFDTNLYHRMMRYPMFPITPKTECVQKIGKGTAIMKSKEKVSAEDAEKLFAILHMTQTGKTTHSIVTVKNFKKELVFIKTTIKSISKTLNSHNKENILKSLQKLTEVTFIFDLKNYGNEKINKKLFTHPILFVDYYDSGEIEIGMEKFFFEICLEKALKINLKSYLQLKGLAKNLYLFFCANMDKTNFLYETIRERCQVEPQIPNFKFRQNLKKALTDITQTGLVKSFTIEKKSVQISFSNQIKTTKTTNIDSSE